MIKDQDDTILMEVIEASRMLHSPFFDFELPFQVTSNVEAVNILHLYVPVRTDGLYRPWKYKYWDDGPL